MRKHLATTLAAVFVALMAMPAWAAEGDCAKSDGIGKLRHVVLFKFKDEASEEDVKQIEDAFRALPEKIPSIVGFEWGTDVSAESLAQGFTHCFLVTFEDAKGRDAYLPHPAHKAFVKLLRPHLDKVLVIDYVAKQ